MIRKNKSINPLVALLKLKNKIQKSDFFAYIGTFLRSLGIFRLSGGSLFVLLTVV